MLVEGLTCPQCSKLNPPEARFCYNCGAAIPPAPKPPKVEPPPQPVEPTYPAYNSAYTYGYPPAGYAPYGAGQTPPTAPADSPYLLNFHPLAQGIKNLPVAIIQQPAEYYSYINPAGQLVFVRKARLEMRFVAGLFDWLLATFPNFILLLVFYGATLEGQNFLNRLADPRRAGLFALLNPGVWWITLFGTLLYYGYFFFSSLRSGQTIGKRMAKIRVMRFDGRNPDALTIGLRYLPGYALSSFLMLGFLAITVDSKRQAWHDKLARTHVVEVNELIEGRDFSR